MRSSPRAGFFVFGKEKISMEEQVKKLIPDLAFSADSGGAQDMKSRVAAVAAKQENAEAASPEPKKEAKPKKPRMTKLERLKAQSAEAKEKAAAADAEIRKLEAAEERRKKEKARKQEQAEALAMYRFIKVHSWTAKDGKTVICYDWLKPKFDRFMQDEKAKKEAAKKGKPKA